MDGGAIGFILFVGLVLYPSGVIAGFIGGYRLALKLEKPKPEEKSGWVSIHDEPFRAVVPGKVKSPHSELR